MSCVEAGSCSKISLGLTCLPKQVKWENLVLKSFIWCKSANSTPAQVAWVKALSLGLVWPWSCQGKPS